MTAIYRGETVRIVRLAGRRSIIIWRGMQKRVHAAELDTTKPPMERQIHADIDSESAFIAPVSAVGLEVIG